MNCICDQLRTRKINEIILADSDYTTLYMGKGYLRAADERCVIDYIRYCPYCGKKFKKGE